MGKVEEDMPDEIEAIAEAGSDLTLESFFTSMGFCRANCTPVRKLQAKAKANKQKSFFRRSG